MTLEKTPLAIVIAQGKSTQAQTTIQALQTEISALRTEIQALSRRDLNR
ncbi:MAG: hypothetical protein JGK24_26320 [Microcoleus sp. PH2017_29_MFU_D_A]|nr:MULTISPECIES: hypothetical protein [unclassified Microcoleus]MCC3417270.1 hypothetical protein [Microcoleus sp. PH2017_07_MST_O_A]MCC3512809.1 hypothetical protein [Microcoleus sp. PH2017_17_BER_D_A]MCC3427148.1 hypothetical protein [Microcoleus sp. PH2017_01_SCD_O_A]MCC3438830.1 hypothetical protein [Microcoleus sp. PH2017_05_CCC_O_A]MCC3450454.1 hypothetical protein [Microcoleus sp. PH2017_09_SFU_O_A]